MGRKPRVRQREIAKRDRGRLLGSNDGPTIMTEHGPVTESARRQAALNMRMDPTKRAEVEALLGRQLGLEGDALLAEVRRRYPEAYEIERVN